MMKKTVIDVGSNSVRLFLSDGDYGKKIIQTTMLAKGMQDGFLCTDSIDRTVQAIADFVRSTQDLGFPLPLIFATEAVRAAKNQAEFIQKLQNITDVPLDILSGDEEATVAFLGAAIDYKDSDASLGVIDIGGASVEYAYGKCSTSTAPSIIYKKSLPLGAIALKNICGDDKESIKRYIDSLIGGFDNTLSPSHLIGVSGTLTSLAAMDLGLEVYDPTIVHGHKITKTKLLKLEKIIFSSLSLTERFKTLSPARAAIIRQGITLILSLLTHFNSNELIISEKDNLEGYLILHQQKHLKQ